MLAKFKDLIFFWLLIAITLPIHLLGITQPSWLYVGSGLVFVASVIYSIFLALAPLFGDRIPVSLRFALTLAIFVSMTVLTGITLSALSVGITRQSWAFAYTCFAQLALVFTGTQRLRGKYHTDIPWKILPSQLFTILFAVLLFLMAYLVAFYGLRYQPGFLFTQFWMMPDTQTSSDGSLMEIGITNGERVPMSYAIEIRLRSEVLARWENISLEPDQTWYGTFVIDPTWHGKDNYLSGYLYLPNSFEPYRETKYWLPALESETP